MNKSNMKCFRCLNRGHKAAECPNPPFSAAPGPPPPDSSTSFPPPYTSSAHLRSPSDAPSHHLYHRVRSRLAADRRCELSLRRSDDQRNDRRDSNDDNTEAPPYSRVNPSSFRPSPPRDFRRRGNSRSRSLSPLPPPPPPSHPPSTFSHSFSGSRSINNTNDSSHDRPLQYSYHSSISTSASSSLRPAGLTVQPYCRNNPRQVPFKPLLPMLSRFRGQFDRVRRAENGSSATVNSRGDELESERKRPRLSDNTPPTTSTTASYEAIATSATSEGDGCSNNAFSDTTLCSTRLEDFSSLTTPLLRFECINRYCSDTDSRWSSLLNILRVSKGTLRSLQLSYCAMTVAQIRSLFELLPELTQLRHFGLSGVAHHKMAATAEAIYLSVTEKTIPCLQSLDFSDNGFEERQFGDLCKWIKELPKLTSLNVSNNKLTPSSMDTLSRTLRKLTALTHLDLSNFYTGYSMSGDAIKFLADILTSNSLIQSLDLAGCSLGRIMHGFERGISPVLKRRAAAAAASTTPPVILRRLNLENNGISDSAMEHLAKLLEEGNCCVEVLNLENNEIGDIGVKHLVDVVTGRNKNDTSSSSSCNPSSTNGCLRVLSLEGNQISDVSASYLRDLLLHNETLLALYVRSNTIYGNKALMQELNSALLLRVAWTPETHKFFSAKARKAIRTFFLTACVRHTIFSAELAQTLLISGIMSYFSATQANCALVNSVYRSLWYPTRMSPDEEEEM